MTDLKTSLSEAVAAAFAAEGVDAALARVVASDRPDLADFQSNGALAAAKALKANPRELAARVAQRLAACVNVIPAMQSIYCWQQKVEQSEECQLLIKSHRELFEPLRLFLREHHPYEVPEIMALPVLLADADYLKWIQDVTR